jgi:hypothetical protein
MFNAIEEMSLSSQMPAEVFACTVGQKPSRAPFYVNDTADVLRELAKLADLGPAGAGRPGGIAEEVATSEPQPPRPPPSVTFAD